MESRLEALAVVFRERPNAWIPALDLADVGGMLSWRTRVSELRHAPHFLNIQNRTRRIVNGDGRVVLTSEYRLVTEEKTSRKVEQAVGAALPL